MADWTTDLSLAEARLAALQAAELKAISGEKVTRITSAAGRTVEFADAGALSLTAIQRAIYECRQAIARLNGSARRGGAIIPVLR